VNVVAADLVSSSVDAFGWTGFDVVQLTKFNTHSERRVRDVLIVELNRQDVVT